MARFQTKIYSIFHQVTKVAAEYTLEKYPDRVKKIERKYIPEELSRNEEGLEAHFAISISSEEAHEYFLNMEATLNI